MGNLSLDVSPIYNIYLAYFLFPCQKHEGSVYLLSIELHTAMLLALPIHPASRMNFFSI